MKQRITTYAIIFMSLLVLTGNASAAIDQPDELQALCDVFDGLDVNTVTDSNEQLQLGLISGLRSLKCRDTQRSKVLLERSAMQGNAEAQYHLCQWYSEREDSVNVIAWCKLSSENGSARGKQAYDFHKTRVVEPALSEGVIRSEKLRVDIRSNSNKSLKDRDALKRAP